MGKEERDGLRAALLGPFAVRRTRRQKDAFIAFARDYGEARGLRVTLEESVRTIRSRNIVFGDVDTARTIITAHYDTGTWIPLLASMAPGCRALLALNLVVQIALLAPLLLLVYFGVPTPRTANDNTSGVLLVLLLMERLAQRHDVAFVLFDNEEKGLLGAQAFARSHPRASGRFLLNLDCVGDGDTLLLTGSKRALSTPQSRALTAALEAHAARCGMRTAFGPFPRWVYPSDQMVFARGAAIAALKGRRVLYLDRIHTPRDTVLRDRNLDCLTDAIAEALHG